MPNMWQENPKEQRTATDVVNDLPRVLQDDDERRKDNEKLMGTKFNSQICTTREQSERLLALGLKKETADMHYWKYEITGKWSLAAMPYEEDNDIPAWSLHRLVSLCNTDNIKIAFNEKDCWGGNMLRISQRKSFEKDNLYDNLCDCIEWLIKEGYFNKEYLV